MPIYEYECESCGKSFELLIRSEREEQEAACPVCTKKRVRRKPSVFSAHSVHAPGAKLPVGGCGRCGDPNGPCGVN